MAGNKRVAILQSNYVPWKGYFDLIAAVDEFVFYDVVQYTKNDWRNRNRIKTPQGPQWLTVPVGSHIHRPIDAVGIAAPGCGRAHWKTLIANYGRCPGFDDVAAWLEPLYCGAPWDRLSVLNRSLIAAICAALGIPTRLTDARTYVREHAPEGDRNERLLSLVTRTGASTYVSGPAARAYLDVAAFARAGVDVRWFDYAGYPEYPQRWGAFVHEVSVLDLLFNCGRDARRYMKCDAR